MARLQLSASCLRSMETFWPKQAKRDHEKRLLQYRRRDGRISDRGRNLEPPNVGKDELDARSRFDPYIEVDTDDQHEISARVEAYFWDPIAVEIDPEGRLIVADSLRHRLQIYQRLAD